MDHLIRLIKTNILVLMVGILSACASISPVVDVPHDLDQQLLTLGVQPSVSPTPGIPEDTDSESVQPAQQTNCPIPYFEAGSNRPNYDLYLYLGINEHAGYVSEQLVYPNLTGALLDELVLVVEPDRIPGVFTITNLRIVGQLMEGYLLDDGYLYIPLDIPLPNGCAVKLDVEYHLEIPEQAGIFGYTEDQLVLTNWYPFVPPYDLQRGWLTNLPGAFGEHLIYPTADFEVTVELADPREELMVAAAALADQEGSRYHYTLEGARTFSLAVLSRYTLKQQNLNGVEIALYSKRASIAEVEASLSTAVAALQVFERVFGPYSFESLTIAQIDMYDGMEFDGIFFLGEEVFDTYNWGGGNMLVFLTVHETAHNWWFSQVGSDQAFEPWLDEALATYCEVLFYELVNPELVDWWWKLRIEEYEPEGFVNANIYTYENDYEAYRRAVYLQGVEFLQALREQMGDEVFFSFLRLYLERGRYQLMTTEDFFSLLEEAFTVKVDALREQFFMEE